MISCQEAVARLWDYVEKDMAPQDVQRIEEHLDVCRRCCGEAEFAGELRSFMSTHVTAAMPPDVRGRLDGFLATLDAPPES